MWLLVVITILLGACNFGNTVVRDGELPVWEPTCHVVKCIETSLEPQYELGVEMSITRCIENVKSMYRYLRIENGWMLIGMRSNRVESCPNK